MMRAGRAGVPWRLGWLWLGAGAIWKSAEIVHNAEFLRSIAVGRHVDPIAMLQFLLNPPPLVPVLIGGAWLVYFRQRDDPVTSDSSPRPDKGPQSPAMERNSYVAPIFNESDAEYTEIVFRKRLIEETEVSYRTHRRDDRKSRGRH
jgi:hypothetical protein